MTPFQQSALDWREIKNSLTTTVEAFRQAVQHVNHKTDAVILSLLKFNQMKSKMRCLLFFTVIDVMPLKTRSNTRGYTIAYGAWESHVSDFEGG